MYFEWRGRSDLGSNQSLMFRPSFHQRRAAALRNRPDACTIPSAAFRCKRCCQPLARSRMAAASTPGQSLDFLLQGQTLEVLIDEPAPGDDASAAPVLRLGIVSMCKGASEFDLETWLTYHVDQLSVERFYLRVEDSSYLRPLLERPPWSERVLATFVEGTLRDWTALATRQAKNVMAAVESARADGLGLLLSLDLDELLYLPRGLQALRAAAANAPPTVCSLHVRNLEAMVPSPTCRHPFASARAFRHRPWEYGAYGYPPSSGKAMGVLACDR